MTTKKSSDPPFQEAVVLFPGPPRVDSETVRSTLAKLSADSTPRREPNSRAALEAAYRLVKVTRLPNPTDLSFQVVIGDLPAITVRVESWERCLHVMEDIQQEVARALDAHAGHVVYALENHDTTKGEPR